MGSQEPYKTPNQYTEEGVDHINIQLSSMLPVGRFLDPGYRMVFDYPFIGRFSSILTLGYWLKLAVKEDEVRFLGGSKLSTYVKSKELKCKNITNYSAIIAKATWIKLQKRPEMIKAIADLPTSVAILCYTTNKVSGVRLISNVAPLVVPVMTEVIAAIRENREPDYTLLANRPKKDKYEYLEGCLTFPVK